MFIYSRFESLIHETGVTKASIARRIGRTPTVCQDWKAGKSEPSADQLQIVAAALGTTPAYLTGATDEKKLPAGAPSDEEDPLDTRLRELLSHADDDLKQAMIAFLERFQKSKKLLFFFPAQRRKHPDDLLVRRFLFVWSVCSVFRHPASTPKFRSVLPAADV